MTVTEAAVEEKVCTKCKVRKVLTDFSPQSRMRDGRASWCKACMAAAGRARRQANPDLHRERDRVWYHNNRSKAQDYNLQKYYGITLEERDEMERKQKGLCAICGRKPSGGRGNTGRLHVDHCHETGVVRGLLCHDCNNGLGRFQDDVGRILAAAAYVQEYR